MGINDMKLVKTSLSDKIREKIPLVYILSASHSGSTLLAMLLGAHPEVCTVGELKMTSLGDINHYRCSCMKEIKKCPFWSSIREDMALRGFTFDFANPATNIKSVESRYVRRLLHPLHRGHVLEKIRDAALSLSPAWRMQLPIIQATNTALMECILSHTGKKIIVDSSKIGIRLKYLLINPSLDVKVIRLIRDGRGVALTYISPAQFADARDPTLRGGGKGGERSAERLLMTDAAREWRRGNEEADNIIKGINRSQCIEVHYEALCTQSEEILHQLFTFIGVGPDKRIRDFRSLEYHIIGNGMRLDSTSEIQLDERWKSGLTDSDLKIFKSIAGDMNRRLGYE